MTSKGIDYWHGKSWILLLDGSLWCSLLNVRLLVRRSPALVCVCVSITGVRQAEIGQAGLVSIWASDGAHWRVFFPLSFSFSFLTKNLSLSLYCCCVLTVEREREISGLKPLVLMIICPCVPQELLCSSSRQGCVTIGPGFLYLWLSVCRPCTSHSTRERDSSSTAAREKRKKERKRVPSFTVWMMLTLFTRPPYFSGSLLLSIEAATADDVSLSLSLICYYYLRIVVTV